jgi:Domain of unknown function (DUF4184)
MTAGFLVMLFHWPTKVGRNVLEPRPMPFTFFAHQVPVLPLKWWRPQWFDGTALCVGSMAPDLAYALDDTKIFIDGHGVIGQFYWSAPITFLLVWIWRRFQLPAVAAQLPAPWGRQFAQLGAAKNPIVTLYSAVIGGATHAALDQFTHGGTWVTNHVRFLNRRIGFDWALFHSLQLVGHTLGSILGFLILRAMVQRGKFSQWSTHSAPWQQRLYLPFWLCVGITALVAAALSAWTFSYGGDVSTAIIRAAWVLWCGVLTGACLLLRTLSPKSQRIVPTQPGKPRKI